MGDLIEQNNKKKILFLTNNQNAMPLYEWIKSDNEVYLYSEPMTLDKIQDLSPDMVISYNYNYIIREAVLNYLRGKVVINLHISFLPWNRGFSPNLWSFIDETPQGVTIHQISAGLDKGKILYQKRCDFDPQKETFVTSYNKLNQTIVELFKENWDAIKSEEYSLYEQKGKGSYHSQRDLELLKQRIDFDWDENVAEFLERYKSLKIDR